MFKLTIKTLEEFLKTKNLIILGDGTLDYPNSDNWFTNEMYVLCGKSFVVEDNVVHVGEYTCFIEEWMCSHWEEINLEH